jgi:putative effector of murein hydrolase
VAATYAIGGDVSAVVAFAERLRSVDQHSRIAALAGLFFTIEEEVGGGEDAYRRLKALTGIRPSPVAEFRTVLLDVTARVAQTLGFMETAASHALGAARSALEDCENGDVIARNTMRQHQRMGIL